MDRDIRATATFRNARDAMQTACRPGENRVSDMADLQVTPDRRRLLFTGTIVQDLAEPSLTRVFALDRETGTTVPLTFGPNCDRHARSSPDGETIAFLSDRDRASDFQLYLLDARTSAVTAGPRVDGWIEYLEWSPDGRRILLGVADHGAELPTRLGACKTAEPAGGEPAWMPRVIGPAPDHLWRRAWVLDIGDGALRCASSDPRTVWESSWCGNDHLIAIQSEDPREGGWYDAELAEIDLATGSAERLYKPKAQIAQPRVSPSGGHVAFVEAISSDRDYVAGDLRLLDRRDGTVKPLDTSDVDVTSVEWISDEDLLLAGHRGLSTVAIRVGTAVPATDTLWEGLGLTASGPHATVVWMRRANDLAFICEGFFDPPRIAICVDGVLALAEAVAEPSWSSGTAEAVRWRAPDGLLIEGWLLRSDSELPHPLIVDVHGGPVLHWRPCWVGRSPYKLALLRRGYAIFLPNPRGSSGRGQAFAGKVVGDVGGADTGDLLSGVDHLVGVGIADPARLGIMGLSYGGFMACWLTTQDHRFACAIAVGPATNHVTQHLTGNIPQFTRLFLQDDYDDLSGRYYSRSPILQARHSRTPTLIVCGDLDLCTPPGEALQFHNALVNNGVHSLILRYPEEGHDILGKLASLDFAARCVLWLDAHIPVPGASAPRLASSRRQIGDER